MIPPIDNLIEKLPIGYTPGPWRHAGSRIGGDASVLASERLIASVHPRHLRYPVNGDMPERDANAALIALAPEMASALSSLQEQKRKLEEALKPFARIPILNPDAEDRDLVLYKNGGASITVGDILDAKAAAANAREDRGTANDGC